MQKTSKEANNTVDRSRLQDMVLTAIKKTKKQGATMDEVCDILYTYRTASITPRFIELERRGEIIRPGVVRKGDSGRYQLVMYAREYWNNNRYE